MYYAAIFARKRHKWLRTYTSPWFRLQILDRTHMPQIYQLEMVLKFSLHLLGPFMVGRDCIIAIMVPFEVFVTVTSFNHNIQKSLCVAALNNSLDMFRTVNIIFFMSLHFCESQLT